MSACERCWRDAGGDPDGYHELLEARKVNPCTPEQQAGPGATKCPTCERAVLHTYTKECMAGCKPHAPAPTPQERSDEVPDVPSR